eukprot:9033968-Pyramimonas_sp.AAC.1
MGFGTDISLMHLARDAFHARPCTLYSLTNTNNFETAKKSYSTATSCTTVNGVETGPSEREQLPSVASGKQQLQQREPLGRPVLQARWCSHPHSHMRLTPRWHRAGPPAWCPLPVLPSRGNDVSSRLQRAFANCR